jgi:next-to-BRCA1 protein 1
MSINIHDEKNSTVSDPVHSGAMHLKASFLSDTTVPDGQVFPPGAEFVKSWHMLNDGESTWPDTTELVFVAGECLVRGNELPKKIRVGGVCPGEEVDLWTGELKVCNNSGME